MEKAAVDGKWIRSAMAQIAMALLATACGASGSGPAANPTMADIPPPTSSQGTSAGVVALAQAAYPLSQTAHSASLSVIRTGGAHGPASVAYGTAYGSALDGINYVNTYGTINWADGDSSPKTIVVPIMSVAPFIGTKSLTVNLSRATGASIGALSGAAVSIVGSIAGQQTPALKKSVGGWVSCSGTSDDAPGLTQAFAAAAHGAFTLVIDCPIRLHVGMDISRPIFIDDGTSVEFAGAGKITVDNVFIPAFVIADSSAVTLSNWNVEYDASTPVDMRVNGYQLGGKFIANPNSQPGNAFNDVRLTSWLSANRGIAFRGNMKSSWSGTTNACGMFFISGDTSSVQITGMKVYAAAGAGADRFIPVVFSLNQNYKARETVSENMAATGTNSALPHDLVFSDITLDGTYMGWVGNARSVVFSNIRSHRYADLQDAQGKQVGGVGKWFAPPHLFYLTYTDATDPLLQNGNVQIANVIDDGPRLGTARDKGGADSISGYALSLKISCNACSVDTYSSSRPDGFLDVLASSNLSISNVTASYDSSFTNNLYPGWRFPSSPYKNLTFSNISLGDRATSPTQRPIGDASQSSNQSIVMQNVAVRLARWSGPQPMPLPNIAGAGTAVSLNYLIQDTGQRIVRAQTDAVTVTLVAAPAAVSAGGTTKLTWSSENAAGCAATGAWSGALPTSGSRSVSVGAAGEYGFALVCANGANASNPATAIVVAN